MAVIQAISFIVFVLGWPIMLTAGTDDAFQGLGGCAMIGIGLGVWILSSLARLLQEGAFKRATKS